MTAGAEAWQPMPDESDALRAVLDRGGVGEWVGRIGVARPGGREHLGAVAGDSRDGLPAGAVALQVGDQCGVDDCRARAPRSSSAETRPPSWPTASSSGSVARARMTSWAMPYTSASSRSRPKRNVSTSGSQERNRGQALVQSVQPFSPWVQLSAPPISATWNGR